MEERRSRRNYSEEFKKQMVPALQIRKAKSRNYPGIWPNRNNIRPMGKADYNTGSTKESDNRTPEQEELLKLQKKIHS